MGYLLYNIVSENFILGEYKMENKTYDLTNPQKSIWTTEQFYEGSVVNNLCGTVSINEVVNFDILKKTIFRFVEDNDAFRTKNLSNLNLSILKLRI